MVYIVVYHYTQQQQNLQEQSTHPLQVFDDFSPVFQASVGILKLETALFQKLSNKPADPAAFAEHKKDLRDTVVGSELGALQVGKNPKSDGSIANLVLSRAVGGAICSTVRSASHHIR